MVGEVRTAEKKVMEQEKLRSKSLVGRRRNTDQECRAKSLASKRR